MSLKTFIKHLWEDIKEIFAALPEKSKEAVAIGNKIVENLKLHKGEIKATCDVIPGDLDSKLIALVTERLPLILQQLQLVNNCDAQGDVVKMLNCAKQVLDNLEGTTVRWDLLDSLAVQLSVVAGEILSDGKLTWNDIKYIMKWYNDHVKSGLPQ